MALPYPTKVVLPFDIATAQDMNERHANDVALANGTGLDDGAVPIKVGVIQGSVLGSTGNKSITGVGFKPQLVKFTVLTTASTTSVIVGLGAMTSTNQFYSAQSTNGTTANRNGSTASCIGWISAAASSSTPALLCSYVSMNADGFTINVSTASGVFDVAYEAYA